MLSMDRFKHPPMLLAQNRSDTSIHTINLKILYYHKYMIKKLLIILVIIIGLTILCFYGYNQEIPNSQIDQALIKRNKFKNPVISITGTCGKTTTTKFIYDIFNNFYDVDKTTLESNSFVGIPHCINKYFRLNSNYWIIELGISKKNDMDNLLKLVQPDIRVLSKIGIAHTEYFDSESDYFKEKLKFIDNSNENTIFIINGDDKIINSHVFPKKCVIIKCGFNKNNDIRITNFQANDINSVAEIQYKNDKAKFLINGLGKYNALNLSLAIGCAISQNISFNDIKNKCKNFNLYDNRGNIIYNKDKSIFLLNHTYNSSFSAVKSNLEYLRNIDKSKNILIILGDMAELQKIDERHEEILKQALDITDNVIIFSILFYKRVIMDKKYNCKLFDDEGLFQECVLNHVKQIKKPLYIFLQTGNEKCRGKMPLTNIVDILQKKYIL